MDKTKCFDHLSLLAEAESALAACNELSAQRLRDLTCIQSRLDAVEALASLFEAWVPTGGHPLGSLHAAGMAFAYANAAKAIRSAALGGESRGDGEVGK